jgi:hypothetical protein
VEEEERTGRMDQEGESSMRPLANQGTETIFDRRLGDHYTPSSSNTCVLVAGHKYECVSIDVRRLDLFFDLLDVDIDI